MGCRFCHILKPTPICKEGTGPNQPECSRVSRCLGCEKQNQKEKEKKKKVVWDERKNIKKRKRRRHTMDKSWLTVASPGERGGEQ